MPDTLLFIVAVNAMINCFASGICGVVLAQRSGVSNWIGAISGIAIPWLGLIVPVAMSRRRGLPTDRFRKTSLHLSGVLLLGLAPLVVVGSLFADWVSGGVQVNKIGNVGDIAEQFSWGAGQSASGSFVLIAYAVALVGLGVGALQHAGLRFAIPAAWLTATAATILLDVVITSSVLAEWAGRAATVTADQAQSELSVGAGAWLAVIGCLLGYMGSLLLVGNNRLSVRAVVGDIATVTPRLSTRYSAGGSPVVESAQQAALPTKEDDGW